MADQKERSPDNQVHAKQRRSLLGKLMSYILPLGAVYAIFCLAIFLSQRSLIYQKSRAWSDKYPVLTFENDGYRICYCARRVNSSRCILYFGGNAEDVTTSMESLCWQFPTESVFALQYRGYGSSEGSPKESALLSDAQKLVELLQTDYEHVVLIGRSLGSGIAVPLAAENEIEKLILITPFDSLTSVARASFPYLPVPILLWDRYESWRVAGKIKVPVLVLAAANDEVIPLASTQRLVDSFKPGLCRFESIEDTTHNSLELPFDTIRQFLQ
jgi:uncharacterized protein